MDFAIVQMDLRFSKPTLLPIFFVLCWQNCRLFIVVRTFNMASAVVQMLMDLRFQA